MVLPLCPHYSTLICHRMLEQQRFGHFWGYFYKNLKTNPLYFIETPFLWI
jgi:hypothetical protein